MIAASDTFAPPGEASVAPAETRTPEQKLRAMFERWRFWLTTIADEKRQRSVIRDSLRSTSSTSRPWRRSW